MITDIAEIAAALTETQALLSLVPAAQPNPRKDSK